MLVLGLFVFFPRLTAFNKTAASNIFHISVKAVGRCLQAAGWFSVAPSNFNITDANKLRNSQQHVTCLLLMLPQIMLANHNPWLDA